MRHPTLIEESLARIADRKGEGARATLTVYADRARAEAGAIDAARKNGAALPRFAGIPLAIKDLFDVKGEPTRAGSKALADAPHAEEDAETVALARSAGFVILGKANMTEFAFGAIGLNPHYGTRGAPGTASVATSPAARPREGRSRSPTAWFRPRSALTPAARAASRRPSAGSLA